MMAMSPAAASPRGFRFITCQSAYHRLTCSDRGSWNSEAGAVARAIRRLLWHAPQAPYAPPQCASLVPDPGVEPRVCQIDDQVQRDEREGHQHDIGLHHGIIAEQDGLDGEPAH